MDFSVLTPDFRLQLEQQCDRLSSERDAIVQAAIEQATATIDASLAHINALLGNAPQSPKVKPSAKGKQKKTIEEEPEVTAIGRPEKVGKKAKASKAADTKAPKTPKQPKVKPSPVDAPLLKSEFKDMDLPEAIPKVFKKDSGRIFSIDNVIHELYGPIDSSIQAKTRQRIGVSLGHCAIRKVIVRVQSSPSMYQLNA
jgi:hypothetical protein